MLALLLTTALMANENATSTQPTTKTVTFSGRVPFATCEMDHYSDRALAKLKQKIHCLDNKSVSVTKKILVLDSNTQQEAWVIEYEKKD